MPDFTEMMEVEAACKLVLAMGHEATEETNE